MKIYQAVQYSRESRTTPTISITFKGHYFFLNKAAMTRLKLKPGDKVWIGLEKPKRLYLITAPQATDGFVLKKKSTGLYFASHDLEQQVMMDMVWAKNGKKSMKMAIGEQEAMEGGYCYRLTKLGQ